MYLPPHFRSTNPVHALALMRAHPLASLVSTDGDGFPHVTHLPLHVKKSETGAGTGDGALYRRCRIAASLSIAPGDRAGDRAGDKPVRASSSRH